MYLRTLAALPQLHPHVHLQTRVDAVTRLGFDKMKRVGRDGAPFQLQVPHPDGREGSILARAVIDASGTVTNPNPLGASGIPERGERALATSIYYGILNVLDTARERYANQRVLIVGSEHSAFNVVIDLVKLSRTAPDTRIAWVVRRTLGDDVYGAGATDEPPARNRLGKRVRQYVERADLTLNSDLKVAELIATSE